MKSILIGLFIGSGVAHLIADYRQQWKLTYLFKPLSLLLLIAVLMATTGLANDYSRWLIAALFASLVGDIFLMLRPQRFIAGLGSFLLAHLGYVGAFWLLLDGKGLPLVAFSILPFAAVYGGYLWSYLGRYRWPVVGYLLVISAMCVVAQAVFLCSPAAGTGWLLGGAYLFALSDAVLAYRKFVRPFAAAQLIVMSTYYAAQLCFVLSAISYST